MIFCPPPCPQLCWGTWGVFELPVICPSIHLLITHIAKKFGQADCVTAMTIYKTGGTRLSFFMKTYSLAVQIWHHVGTPERSFWSQLATISCLKELGWEHSKSLGSIWTVPILVLSNRKYLKIKSLWSTPAMWTMHDHWVHCMYGHYSFADTYLCHVDTDSYKSAHCCGLHWVAPHEYVCTDCSPYPKKCTNIFPTSLSYVCQPFWSLTGGMSLCQIPEVESSLLWSTFL